MTLSNPVNDTRIALDFTRKAPCADVPLGWLDHEMEWTGLRQDDTRALMLAAAVFSNPEVHGSEGSLVSEESLAVRLLALIAAGAPVYLHERDAAETRALALELAARVEPELGEDIEYIVRRFDCRDTSRHFVELELLDGRGYCDLGSGIPADYWDKCAARQRLLLVAALMSAAKPRLCKRGPEAVVMLALYGAGCGFSLTRSQFNRLWKAAQTYRSHLKAQQFEGFANHKMTNYVLRRAYQRAQREELVGRSSGQHA